jgi:hypothetical protein
MTGRIAAVIGLACVALLAGTTSVSAYCQPPYSCEGQGGVYTRSPDPLNFGPQPFNGGRSEQMLVTITAHGDCSGCGSYGRCDPQCITGVQFQSDSIGNGNDFTKTSDGCAGQTLSVGQSCQVTIKFSPNDCGNLRTNLSFKTVCPGEFNNTPSDCISIWGHPYDYYGPPVTLKADVTGCSITQPTGSVVSLSTPTSTADPGSANVTFQADAPSTTTTKWTTALRYRPSERNKTFHANLTPANFPTKGTTPATQPYHGQGGFLTVHAHLGPAASSTASVAITGWPLSDAVSCVISSELKSLYTAPGSGMPAGGMPQLLERLANTESSYEQFFYMPLAQPPTYAKSSLPSVSGYWPHESYAVYKPNGKVKTPAGKYIGLMQVKNSEDNAWNWIDNARLGNSMFQSSLTYATNHKRNTEHYYSIPPQPTQQEAAQIVEQLAVGAYKGFSNKKKTYWDWYWVPQCSKQPFSGNCPYTVPLPKDCAGSWSWIKNPCPCKGSNYASTCDPIDKGNGANDVLIQVDKITSNTAPCEQ